MEIRKCVKVVQLQGNDDTGRKERHEEAVRLSSVHAGAAARRFERDAGAARKGTQVRLGGL